MLNHLKMVKIDFCVIWSTNKNLTFITNKIKILNFATTNYNFVLAGKLYKDHKFFYKILLTTINVSKTYFKSLVLLYCY